VVATEDDWHGAHPQDAADDRDRVRAVLYMAARFDRDITAINHPDRSPVVEVATKVDIHVFDELAPALRCLPNRGRCGAVSRRLLR
jgi:hypothetical protein